MTRGDILKQISDNADGIGLYIQIDDKFVALDDAIAIWQALNDQRSEATQEKPSKTTQGKKEHKKRVQIDDGKIKALRNAGWTLDKIADEMGCTATTISKHLADISKLGKEA